MWVGSTLAEESELVPEQSLPKTLMFAYIALKFLKNKTKTKPNQKTQKTNKPTTQKTKPTKQKHSKGKEITFFLLYCYKLCYISLFFKMLPGSIIEFYSYYIFYMRCNIQLLVEIL